MFNLELSTWWVLDLLYFDPVQCECTFAKFMIEGCCGMHP